MGLLRGLIALMLVVPVPLMAAAPAVAPSTAPATREQQPAPQLRVDDLDEVVVEGRRQGRLPRSWNDYQQPFDFLAMLVGKFTVAGQVDLRGQGNKEDLREVSGLADCLGFGSAPGVMCELIARWPAASGPQGEEIPGGVSAMDPAMLLFGMDSATTGISFTVLDNRGDAQIVVGKLASPNTMVARSKCMAAAGNCERTARVTVEPDRQTVRMNIDLAFDQQPSVRFMFVMNRVPGSSAVVYGRKQEKKK